MTRPSPSDIRRWRLDANLSQTELAEKLRASQSLISAWERGVSVPADDDVDKLQQLFGAVTTGQVNAFGEWVKREREKHNWTVSELAEASDLSAPAIYKIEAGEIANPRQSTREKISKALGIIVPEDVVREISEAASIEGLGEMIDFDPHEKSELPKLPGVYVLYDISDRPIYVGQGKSADSRLKDHSTRFWYKDPIVRSGSFIEIKNEELRSQVETLLIRFLRKNAIINKQHVNDDDR